MEKKVCLVTGGNAGIGRAAAVLLAQRGAEVIITSRNAERGQAAVDIIRQRSGSEAVSLLIMDLSSKHSIAAACEVLRARYARLDVLVHNAADFDVSRRQPVYSDEGIETVWATNHIGPVFLTRELMPELVRGGPSRVIMVSSKGLILHPFLRVDLDDPEFRQRGFTVERAYYQSKLAQVMYTYWLAEQWRGTPRTANCVRVTNVRIDTDRYPKLSAFSKWLYRFKARASISPERMAETYAWLALSPEVECISGGYFDENCQAVKASRYASDAENIGRVMELTERFLS